MDTLICNGSILMKNRKVASEEEILEKAGSIARDLLRGSSDG